MLCNYTIWPRKANKPLYVPCHLHKLRNPTYDAIHKLQPSAISHHIFGLLNWKTRQTCARKSFVRVQLYSQSQRTIADSFKGCQYLLSGRRPLICSWWQSSMIYDSIYCHQCINCQDTLPLPYTHYKFKCHQTDTHLPLLSLPDVFYVCSHSASPF